MATSQSALASAAKLARESEKSVAAEVSAEHALVPSLRQVHEGDHRGFSGSAVRLPVELDVSVPVREFRVRNLPALESGQVIETRLAHGEDMPLASGEVQLAWSEFEVVDAALAVRITRLA